MQKEPVVVTKVPQFSQHQNWLIHLKVMTFILNSHNVFHYLIEQGLCNQSEQPPSKIEPLTAKNFNLLLSLSNDRKLLVQGFV